MPIWGWGAGGLLGWAARTSSYGRMPGVSCVHSRAGLFSHSFEGLL